MSKEVWKQRNLGSKMSCQVQVRVVSRSRRYRIALYRLNFPSSSDFIVDLEYLNPHTMSDSEKPADPEKHVVVEEKKPSTAEADLTKYKVGIILIVQKN